MTTSRIVRGTKGRIFLYVCAVLIITGIIACYNNTRLQLEDVSKTSELCHQQQEHLTSQLQVIFDYKQRLEKSLKAEKGEHQQSKLELEKLKQENDMQKNVLNENKISYSSLQQQHKKLDRDYRNLTEEATIKQRRQTNEINSLQAKLKEVQKSLKQLTQEKDDLENQVDMLKKEKESHNKVNLEIGENIILPALDIKRTEVRNLNFSKQIQQGKAAYELQNDANDFNININDKNELKPKDVNNSQFVIPMPLPNNGLQIKSSTKTSVSKGSLEGVHPLGIPTATPETKIKSSSQPSNLNPNLPIPNKVVQLIRSKSDAEVNLPGRYGNNVIQNAEKTLEKKDTLNRDDKENDAQEEIDAGIEKENQLDLNNDILETKSKHIDALVQPDEPELDKMDPEDGADEDDDVDDYPGNQDKQKDPAIRN